MTTDYFACKLAEAVRDMNLSLVHTLQDRLQKAKLNFDLAGIDFNSDSNDFPADIVNEYNRIKHELDSVDINTLADEKALEYIVDINDLYELFRSFRGS